jgi:hypothetical protein
MLPALLMHPYPMVPGWGPEVTIVPYQPVAQLKLGSDVAAVTVNAADAGEVAAKNNRIATEVPAATRELMKYLGPAQIVRSPRMLESFVEFGIGHRDNRRPILRGRRSCSRAQDGEVQESIMHATLADMSASP